MQQTLQRRSASAIGGIHERHRDGGSVVLSIGKLDGCDRTSRSEAPLVVEE
jgi:hypothetical protein